SRTEGGYRRAAPLFFLIVVDGGVRTDRCPQPVTIRFFSGQFAPRCSPVTLPGVVCIMTRQVWKTTTGLCPFFPPDEPTTLLAKTCPMRVLITGGYGCIGAWIVRQLLSRGDSAWIYDLQQDPRRLRLLLPEEQVAQVGFHQGDVTDLDNLRRAVAG